MKVLNLSGSSFDIGRQHGERAKQEIEYSLDSYEKLFRHEANLDWKQAIELSKIHMDAIEKANVNLLEEMEGIAKGASVDFYDILVLNARSEIALTHNKSDGCTSVAVMPPLGGKAYLAQTWDWRSAQTRSLIITKIKQEGLPTISMITEGGIIGKIGFNSEGLGVCLNALRADVKSKQLPVHLGLREVLNSVNLEEAQSKVSEGKIGSSANFLMAQDNGELKRAVNMELSPNTCDKRETDSAYLYHTNHFCSNPVKKTIGQENLNVTENSFLRQDRMQKLIGNHSSRKIHGSTIRSWLSDHKNYPYSICRHKEDKTSDYTDTITAFAVIMNLTDKTMHLLEGQPCNPINEKYLKLS